MDGADGVAPGSGCNADAAAGEERCRSGVGTSALTGAVSGDVGPPALGGSCAEAGALQNEDALTTPSATELHVAAKLRAGNRLAMTTGDVAANYRIS
jgi:hypothetical protein